MNRYLITSLIFTFTQIHSVVAMFEPEDEIPKAPNSSPTVERRVLATEEASPPTRTEGFWILGNPEEGGVIRHFDGSDEVRLPTGSMMD